MRNLACLVLVFGAVGCDGGVDVPIADTGDPSDFGTDTDVDTDTDTGTDTDTDTDSDTSVGPVTGAEGSITLVHFQDDSESSTSVALMGLFSDSNQGFFNAGECVLYGYPCLADLPTGADAFVDSTGDWEQAGASLYSLGGIVQLGGYEGVFKFDSWTSLGYLYGTNPATWTEGESLGLVAVGGDWGSYSGTNDITLPGRMIATAPNASVELALVSDEVLTLEWQVGGAGEVYLYVVADGLSRAYHLVDDGSFDLDIGSLPMSAGATELVLALNRVNTSTVDVNGNALEIIARSEQRWYAELTNIGDRVNLDPSLTCGAAGSAAALSAGSYYGRITSTANVLDPGSSGCTERAAPGGEAIVALEIPAGHLVNVDYKLPAGKAATYLLTDCASAATCLDGGAVTYTGSTASVSHYNQGGSAETVYLVLDATDATGLFFLDVEMKQVDFVEPAETCGDAAALPSLEAGSYYGDLSGYKGDMDACTTDRMSGTDGVFKVVLLPDERISVDLTQDDAAAGVYLMSDCADSATCLADDDVYSAGSKASFAYINSTGAEQTVWLVVDGRTGGGPYWLDVRKAIFQELVIADTCAGAASLPDLATGSYYGVMDGFANDLDPTYSGCTGFSASGSEGMVPVTLASGESIDVRYSLDSNDASVYLLTDCSSVSTCVAGVDKGFGTTPEELSYKNTSGSTQSLYLVLDGWTTTGDFMLDVTIK